MSSKSIHVVAAVLSLALITGAAGAAMEFESFDTGIGSWTFNSNWGFGDQPNWSNTNAAGGASGPGELVADGWAPHDVQTTLADHSLADGVLTPAMQMAASGRMVIPASSVGSYTSLRYVGFADDVNYNWDGTLLGLTVDGSGNIGMGIYYDKGFNKVVDAFSGVSITPLINNPFSFEYQWNPGTGTLAGTITPDVGSPINLSLTLDAADLADLADATFSAFGMIGTQHNWEGYSGSISMTLDDAYYGVVPEPTTMGLLGLGAMAVLRRRR